MKSWKTPTPEQVAKAVALLGRSEQYRYFFDRLENPEWIRPLRQRGFFLSPPQPVRDEVKGTIRFPPWPESRYLARMAKHVPQTVLEIALEITPTENVSVHEDLADAAISMPPAMAARWVVEELRWTEQQESLSFLLPEKLGALVAHLAQGSQGEAALDLARSLLSVLPDPRRGAEKDETYRLPPAPRARFDDWTYGQILKKHLPILITATKVAALNLLCDILDSAVRLSRRQDEDEDSDDYSYVWRPAIEDHPQNRPREGAELRKQLVTAVRDAAEKLALDDPSIVPNIVRTFEDRPRRIFHRLALHLLRRFPEMDPSFVADRLTDRARFDEFELSHEYALLLRDRFRYLLPNEQNKILRWLEEGPDIEQFKESREEWTGTRPTDEEAERYARAWRLTRLALIRDDLPEGLRRSYDEWVAELGEPEHPDFASYRTGTWVGPTSPKGAEDLRSMTIEEMVGFLKSWQLSWEPGEPSPEGLGRVLAPLVASDPERFAVAASQFKGLDPTYVRAFLSGFRDATSEKKSFPWPPLLDLCKWILEQPREGTVRRAEYADLDPGWGWTRKTIADLLSRGFTAGPAEIPFELRTTSWQVLCALTEDPDPTRDAGSGMDPATLSINSTRGEAMHATVRYALWVRRRIQEGTGGGERVRRGFREMPEVDEVLDLHLDPDRDPAPAIRAVYGQWFPWLVLLDPEWARSRVSRIFPSEESSRELHDSAWETYILFCAPYDNVFELLREGYIRAVDRIGVVTRERRDLGDPEERLAEHLMTFYWRGKFSLEEGGVLDRFFVNASDVLCGYALDFVGQSLQNTKGEVDPEILGRIQTLWGKRLDVVRRVLYPVSHTNELAAFGSWFASAKFDDSWAMTQLTQSLELAGKTEPDYIVVERLAAVARAMPAQAVDCLRLIVQADKEGWTIYGWREHARAILAIALQSTDSTTRQAATALVNRLGERGYRDFRDLLSRKRS